MTRVDWIHFVDLARWSTVRCGGSIGQAMSPNSSDLKGPIVRVCLVQVLTNHSDGVVLVLMCQGKSNLGVCKKAERY